MRLRSDSEMRLHDAMLEKLRCGYIRERSVRAAKAKIESNALENNQVGLRVATDRILKVWRADDIVDRRRAA